MRQNPNTRRIGEHVNGYRSASQFLGNKEKRKLANNTWIVRGGDDSIGVVLHKTTIVRYYPNGTVTLNSGGYRSATTKQRINQLLPAGVSLSQKDYEWTVVGFGQRIPFEDGMVIAPPGIREFNMEWDAGDDDGEDYGTWDVGDRDYHENPHPGKFDTALDKAVYLLTVDGGADEEIADNGGWSGLVCDITKSEVLGKPTSTVRLAGISAREIEDDMESEGISFPFSAIVFERSDGICEVDYFESAKDAEVAWAAWVEAFDEEEG